MKSKQYLPVALNLVLVPLCLQSSTLAIGLFQPVFGAAPAKRKPAQTSFESKAAAAPLSTASLVDVVEKAKVLAPEYPVHCGLQGNEAIVITVRNGNATDQDCKIDAVLLAKAIMDVYPKDVIRVKFLLSHAGDGGMQEVAVTMGDVKAFATGTITKEQLLSSLELSKVTAKAEDVAPLQPESQYNGPPVAAGPQMHARQLLAARIQNLKQRGIGTKPYEDIFAQIETMAQKPATECPRIEIQQAIKDLAGKLNDQEQATNSAQNLSQGRGSGLGRRAFRNKGGGGMGGANFNPADHPRLQRFLDMQKKQQLQSQ